VVIERIRRDTGGDRSGRNDDTPEAVLRRLQLFRRRTLPLLAFYRCAGVPVLVFEAGLQTTPEMICTTLERHGPPSPAGPGAVTGRDAGLARA
jgi:hypothetical protein